MRESAAFGLQWMRGIAAASNRGQGCGKAFSVSPGRGVAELHSLALTYRMKCKYLLAFHAQGNIGKKLQTAETLATVNREP